MDLGDIIYFLLIAIGVIGSFFKKKKKPEYVPPADTSNNQDYSSEKENQSFEELIESYFPGSKQEKVEEEKIEFVPEKKVEKQKVKSTFKRPSKKHSKESEIFLEEEPILKETKIEFDLRKAVINDAILNRPNY